MNRIFYIDKSDIISEVMVMFNKIKRRKINIELNMGEVIYFEDPDSFLYVTKTGEYKWQNMSNTTYSDLILMLKYLQNITNCENIKSENTLYDFGYNSTKNEFMLLPINKKCVDKLIIGYLKNKRTTAERKKKIDFDVDKIKMITNYINLMMKPVLKFFPNYNLNVVYDIKNNRFILETNSIDSDVFTNNLIIVMNNVRDSFHYKCCVKKI